MHRASEEAPTTAGLLLSLAAELPRGAPLARRARTVARHLTQGAATRAAQRRAADLLCDLLDAADTGLCAETDGLLDDAFDD